MAERTVKSESKETGGARAKAHRPNFEKDIRPENVNGFMLQRQAACACGGDCPTCQTKPSNLPISHPADASEIEADRVADSVMRSSANTSENKLSGSLSKNITPIVQTKSNGCGSRINSELSDKITSSRGGGSSLNGSTQSFMQSRFGLDFSGVKIHTGKEAAETSRKLNAKAFTVGKDIYFNEGQYQPESESGKRLLAHELAHVQQQSDDLYPTIQRYCEDDNFCKPYDLPMQAQAVEELIRETWVRLEGLETYGTEVKSLYESYLDRRPGDSLDPRIFDSEESYIVQSFKSSWDTINDHDAVIDLVGERLSSAPSGSIREDQETMMGLSNFLSESEMNNRPINYSNPFSVAGHIAGGLGSSDAGDDYRKITHGNVTIERVTILGVPAYTNVGVVLSYEIFDAIDFCPGDCGSPAEQLVTVPMSRLEASGFAYDVPFKVIFTAEKRWKRFWL